MTEATSSDIDKIYPVGLIVWFAQNKNPNTLFRELLGNILGKIEPYDLVRPMVQILCQLVERTLLS